MNTYKRVFVTCLFLASMASIVCHAHDLDTASLIQQLEHADTDVRKSARKALIEMGEAAVPALIVGLNHEKTTVREYVVYILHDIRKRVPHNKDIVRTLVKALKDDDEKVRDWALVGFLDYSELPPEVISGLVQLLYYGSPFYHPGASEVLVKDEGVWNPQAAAALIEALHSSEWSLRFGTALAYSFGDGRRQLRLEFPNKRNQRNKKKPPSPELKSIRLPYTGEPPPPGTTKAVVSTLIEGLTHPDWKAQNLVIFYLEGYAHDFDEAKNALEALPPFGIIFQTIRDGDTVRDSDVLDSLNTDGITFKFNRSLSGYLLGEITIRPVTEGIYGEPLGWNVERGSHSITITPPEGKELVKEQDYTIQLREFEDALGYHELGAEIDFSTEVPLRRAP